MTTWSEYIVCKEVLKLESQPVRWHYLKILSSFYALIFQEKYNSSVGTYLVKFSFHLIKILICFFFSKLIFCHYFVTNVYYARTRRQMMTRSYLAEILLYHHQRLHCFEQIGRWCIVGSFIVKAKSIAKAMVNLLPQMHQESDHLIAKVTSSLCY